MASWWHTHHFKALNENTTHIHEHLVYEHHSGWRGLLTKILFGRLGLMALFSYRKWITRRVLNTGVRSL